MDGLPFLYWKNWVSYGPWKIAPMFVLYIFPLKITILWSGCEIVNVSAESVHSQVNICHHKKLTVWGTKKIQRNLYYLVDIFCDIFFHYFNFYLFVFHFFHLYLSQKIDILPECHLVRWYISDSWALRCMSDRKVWYLSRYIIYHLTTIFWLYLRVYVTIEFWHQKLFLSKHVNFKQKSLDCIINWGYTTRAIIRGRHTDISKWESLLQKTHKVKLCNHTFKCIKICPSW